MKNLKLSVVALLFVMAVFFTPSFAQTADSDGDGVPDSEDVCPMEKGTKANKGCAEQTKKTEQTPNISVSEADLLKLEVGYAEEINARDLKYRKLAEQYSTKASGKLRRENLLSRMSEMTAIKQICTKVLADFGNKISASSKKFFTERLNDSESKLKIVSTLLVLVGSDEKDSGLGDDFLDKVLTNPKPQVKTGTNVQKESNVSNVPPQPSAQSDVDAAIAAVSKLVEQGEQALKSKNYVEAERIFTEAIAAEDKANIGAARRNYRAYLGLAFISPGGVGYKSIRRWFSLETSSVAAYLYAVDIGSKDNPNINYITEAILLEPENPAHFVARARLMKASSTPAAVADYTIALILNPKYALALRERGEIYLASGEYDKAFADFESYSQAGGDEQFYRLRRGMAILLKVGATEEAVRDLTQATTGADANLRGEAFYYRGWANFLGNNRPAAQADMTEAAKVDPKLRDDFYYRLAFEALPANKCKSPKDFYRDEGKAYEDKNLLDNRRELSFQLFKINTVAIGCHPTKGEFNFRRVDRTKTVGEFSGNPLLDVSDMRRHQALTSANERDSDFREKMVSALFRGGINLSNPSESGEKYALFYRTVKNGFVPGDTAGNLKRAAEDIEKGEYHRAIAVLNGILRVEPDNSAALELRMRAFYLKKAVIRADAEAARILKIKPNSSSALNIRGLYNLEANNPDGAIDYFNRSFAADPKNAKLIINRGRAYLVKKRYPAALADFESGLKLAPNVSDYIKFRGDAYFLMQKWEEAAVSYTEVIVLNEKDLPARVNLIRALDRTGKNKSFADDNHAWLIKNAPDYEGTKALASRNKELNTQVTKDIEARKVEMKVIELHQQMVNTMESAASTGKLPTENTSISERISRLSKMRSDYYNVIRNGIGAEFYRIERENLPVKPEVIRGLEKLVAQADEMKAIAKRNLAEVEAVLKKLQGYL